MSVEVAEFQEFLKQKQLKLTSQREAILKRALRTRKHFSAEELFEALREEKSGISKATVYRTLSLLVEAGLLAEHDFERGHKLYERATHQCHHDHLICISCQRIIEFQNEEIERLQEEVAERHGFAMISHTHQIFGRCQRCRDGADGAARA